MYVHIYICIISTYILRVTVVLVNYYLIIMVVYVLSVKTTEEVRIVLALRQLKKHVATFNGHIFNENL